MSDKFASKKVSNTQDELLDNAELPTEDIESSPRRTRLSPKQRRQRLTLIAGVLGVFVLLAGAAVATVVSRSSLDIRQRATNICYSDDMCGSYQRCINGICTQFSTPAPDPSDPVTYGSGGSPPVAEPDCGGTICLFPNQCIFDLNGQYSCVPYSESSGSGGASTGNGSTGGNTGGGGDRWWEATPVPQVTGGTGGTGGSGGSGGGGGVSAPGPQAVSCTRETQCIENNNCGVRYKVTPVTANQTAIAGGRPIEGGLVSFEYERIFSNKGRSFVASKFNGSIVGIGIGMLNGTNPGERFYHSRTVAVPRAGEQKLELGFNNTYPNLSPTVGDWCGEFSFQALAKPTCNISVKVGTANASEVNETNGNDANAQVITVAPGTALKLSATGNGDQRTTIARALVGASPSPSPWTAQTANARSVEMDWTPATADAGKTFWVACNSVYAPGTAEYSCTGSPLSKGGTAAAPGFKYDCGGKDVVKISVVTPAPRPVTQTVNRVANESLSATPTCTLFANNQEASTGKVVNVKRGSAVSLRAVTGSTNSERTQIFIAPVSASPAWLPAPNRASGASPQTLSWTPTVAGRYYVACNQRVNASGRVSTCTGNPICDGNRCPGFTDCGTKDLLILNVTN